ncbi:MAG: polymer-forming cytoskeletal protein [Candidatus Dormibacterales bacterium]
MTKLELEPEVSSTNGEADAQELDSRPTVLARDDSLSGRLQMSGSGQVLGNFSGEIECQGELTVGPDAHIEADIRTARITVAGYVRGNVVATNRLKIKSTGRLEGDARVGALVVEEGGVHVGVIRVHPEGVPESDASVDEAVAPREPATIPRAMPDPVARVRKFWGEFF